MLDAASKTELLEAAQKAETIIAGTVQDEPGTDTCDQCDPWQRLARVGLLLGRMIAVIARA